MHCSAFIALALWLSASGRPTRVVRQAGAVAARPAGNNAGVENVGGGRNVAAAGAAAQPEMPPAHNNGGALDPSVICTAFADDGQNPPVDGQTASLTSTNNFINFCALTLPQIELTNGLQNPEGSCNPTPIGLIPSVDKMPSAKFLFPKNFGTIPANQDFTVTLNIKNLQAGTFTNAVKTYFAAPQTLNAQGVIIGHSQITIERLSAIDATEPLDPKKPFFFKGINTAAVNGVLSIVITGGHRMCTINSSGNHQPAIVPVAQHGLLDDCIYFTGV
ncbi:hypothetical protein C8J57DRAFT_1522647 [Mycena rebaudengoi]|nr:hypothetical protein C8J57DRAFT_1522647 [Mycena rebaudengoi]